MSYKTREQVEREAAKEAGRLAGERDERARLRPLLERCLSLIETLKTRPTLAEELLLADLRRELGKDAPQQEKRYVAVDGGGEHCPDGEPHRPIGCFDGLRCWRCNSLIRELGKET